MFIALFLKEWKEKAGIFMFGVGLLAFSMAVYLGLPKDQNARELVMGGLVILFFPFMALLIGSGAFEPESRNGAWAYLFSRPVRKGSIWAVKYFSLLSVLAGLWLVFLAMMLLFPGLRALAEGFKIPIAFQAEVMLLPWSLFISLVLFTVAFSISPFSGKWLNVLFVALFLGLAMAVAAYQTAMAVTSLLLDAWLDGEKWLHMFRWDFGLMAAALAAASILTLTHADFSQPRKKILRFAGYAAPFLIAAMVVAAAWTALLPRTAERDLGLIGTSRGESLFCTEQGIFRYDPAGGKITRLTKAHAQVFGFPAVQNGNMAYVDIDPRSGKENPFVLWYMNTDGTGKKRLAGGGIPAEDRRSRLATWNFLLSPDGKRIVLLDTERPRASAKDESPLWSMTTDGTDLKNPPVNPAMIDNSSKYPWNLIPVAWKKGSGESVLILQRMARNSGLPWRIWLCNFLEGTCRVLFEYTVTGWYTPVSPGGNYLAVPHKIVEKDKSRLAIALIDLNSLEIRDIEVGEGRGLFRLTWSPKGDRLAYFLRNGTSRGSGRYVVETLSVADGRRLASKELTVVEDTGQQYLMDWLADGVRLVLDDPAGDKALKILGSDLSEEKRFALPDSVLPHYNLQAAGDKILIAPSNTHRLWRLDLKTGSWKRIF